MQEETAPEKPKETPKAKKHEEPYHDIHTMLEWHAPGRPFKNHSKEYFINIFLITVAIEIIIFLFHVYLLMLVVLALAFLGFAMAVAPPHVFYYKITSEGIRVEDNFFLWEELYDFYFMRHNGIEVVKIGTQAFFPGELTLMLGEVTPAQIKKALLPFLPFREYVKPAFTQKAGDWLEKNFPLEKATGQNLPTSLTLRGASKTQSPASPADGPNLKISIQNLKA